MHRFKKWNLLESIGKRRTRPKWFLMKFPFKTFSRVQAGQLKWKQSSFLGSSVEPTSTQRTSQLKIASIAFCQPLNTITLSQAQTVSEWKRSSVQITLNYSASIHMYMYNMARACLLLLQSLFNKLYLKWKFYRFNLQHFVFSFQVH